jgi:large subunit ribosomal protein L9
MKIILIETLENVGKAGQVITVKDGFARNYLLPKKYAIIATATNLKKVEKIEADAKAKFDKKNAEYRELAEKIRNLSASFARRSETDGKLFGSVSEVDIVKFLADNEISISKANVLMDKHIKSIGEFEVIISFSSEITSTLKFSVTSLEE